MPENEAPERPRGQRLANADVGLRKARFMHLVRRARKAVDGEPRLTADELRELAGIFGTAADQWDQAGREAS